MLRTILTVICLGLSALIVVDVAQHAGSTAPPAGTFRPVHHPASIASAAGSTPPIPAVVAAPQAGASQTPALDMIARLAVRRRLAREGAQVYLDSQLVHTDSVLTRWADRRVLRVVLVPDTTLAGWSPALLDEARSGMRAWVANGSGLNFQEVGPTDSADITVHWVRALPDTSEVGLTSLAWGADGVIHSAVISLALRAADSLAVPPAVRARVAVHEFGHALGLPHSDNSEDVMFHTSPVNEPSQRDQATLRLLYAVPPGPLRIPPQF